MCLFPIFPNRKRAALLQLRHQMRALLMPRPSSACWLPAQQLPKVPPPTSPGANQDLWDKACGIKESLGCKKQSCGKRRADRQEGAGSRAGQAGLDRTCSISDVIRLSGFSVHGPVAVGSGSAPLVFPVPLAGQDFTPEVLLVFLCCGCTVMW